MFIAKVVGSVWSTRKHKMLEGNKLLLVKPFEPKTKKYLGNTTMAVCSGISAGVGDTVAVLDEGGSARKILAQDNAPVRTIVCAIIDKVYITEKTKNG
jgi:microcompartment protein CcmK/EutM